MAEYIERESILMDILCAGKIGKMTCIDIIKRAKAADVVSRDCYDRLLAENDELRKVRPVVRCRDCDHWNEWDHAGHESLGNFRCSCAYWSVEDGVTFYTAPTDFCSNGEKRIDGDVDDKM